MKFHDKTSKTSVIKYKSSGSIAGVAMTFALLTACGESDLRQIQLDAIAQAQLEASAQPPASPAEGGANGTPDMVDNGTPVESGADVDEVIAGSQIVFSDEFNSATLDASKWNTKYQWGPDIIVNDEQQYYVNALEDTEFGVNPFVFDGETVSITAQLTPADMLSGANNQPYLSGVLTSSGHFDFTYGYAEIRAKLPAGTGYWPGFWMLGSEFVDNKPQLYIMENKGDVSASVYHRYNYSDADGSFVYSDLLVTNGPDFHSGFHTYGVDWSPGSLDFYVDGTLQHTITDENVSSQDMYLILNLAVGGWFPGSPDASTVLPGAYMIDYVRIYQKNQ